MTILAQQVLATLSMHAKLHKRLDAIPGPGLHKRQLIEKLEEEEIRAYDDTQRYAKLEALKKELLGIKFIEQ